MKNWYQIEEIWKEEVVIGEQIEEYENLEAGEHTCLAVAIFFLAVVGSIVVLYPGALGSPSISISMAISIVPSVACFALWRWFHRKINATMETLVAAFEQEFGIRPPAQKTRATMKVVQQFVDARLNHICAIRGDLFEQEDKALRLRALTPECAEAAIKAAEGFAPAIRVAKEELEERASLAKFFGFNTRVV